MRRIISLILVVLPTLAQALELIMVEQAGCYYCREWKKEIAPIYPKTEVSKHAPLSYIDIRDAANSYSLARAVIFTPTFLLVDDAGKELSRLEGYQSEDFFWALLEEQVAEHDPAFAN